MLPLFLPTPLALWGRDGQRGGNATQGPTPVTVQPAVGVKPPRTPVCGPPAVAMGTEKARPLTNVGLGGHMLQSGSRRVRSRVGGAMAEG